MLFYEENRTESIVKRLITAARLVKASILWIWCLNLGILGTVCGYFVIPHTYFWLIGLALGLFLGYKIGNIISFVITAGIEWMAQMLVVQENILNRMKER